MSKDKGLNDAPPVEGRGYYGNYREMKEHASRHPKAMVHGGIGAQHIIEGTSMDNNAMSLNQVSSEPADSVRHLTERDVHDHFKGQEVRGRLEATKHAAKGVGMHCLLSPMGWNRCFFQLLPILHVIKNYDRSYIFFDVIAGISAGIAAVPIGMSYARLGNFKPQHGLYCQLFYSAAYIFFGTGRQVCVGTSAVEGMICAQAISKILGAVYQEHQWYNVSYGLSFFVGIFLIAMRCLNLGVISSFLADSVVSGFSTGCALAIAVSQLQHVFGVHIDQQLKTYEIIIFVFKNYKSVNIACLMLGFAGMVLLYVMDVVNAKYFRRYPIPSSLVFVFTFLFVGYRLKIDQPPYNVPVVGEIAMGLPSPQLFTFESHLLIPVIQQALQYAMVYYLMHISVANRFAQKHGYLLDYDQELFATGMCSLFGSFFQCYPVATSVARSSIVDTAGGKTQLYNILNVLVILVVITKLTPLLYYLPWPCLASIVMYGVSKMFHFSEAVRLSKLFSFDFVLWLVSFLCTIFFSAMEGKETVYLTLGFFTVAYVGIIASVALSLLWIVKQNAFPPTAVLGRLPGTKLFRDIRLFKTTHEVQGCKILRFDASFNFSNTLYFERLVYQLMNANLDDCHVEKDQETPTEGRESKCRLKLPSCFRRGTAPRRPLRHSEDDSVTDSTPKVSNESRDIEDVSCVEISHAMMAMRGSLTQSNSIDRPKVEGGEDNRIRVLIIDASSVNHVDVTAIRMLRGLAKRFEEHNMIMLFANWKGPMRGFLEKAHFYDTIPPDHCFLSIHDAVLWAEVFYLHRDPSVVRDVC